MCESISDPVMVTLWAKPENLAEIRHRVAAMMVRFVRNPRPRNHILLAIEEAVQNIVRYAYRPEELPGRIDLSAWREGVDVVVELRDFAAPSNLDNIRPRVWDPSRPGGLGLRLMRAAMDDVVYSPAPGGDGNCLRMRKHID